MTKDNHLSRFDRRHKRRNNNLQIFIFGGLAAIIFIVLLLVISSDDQEANQEVVNNDSNENEQVENSPNDEHKEEDKNNETKDEKDKEKEDDKEEKKAEHYLDRETYAENIRLQALTTTDPNVKEAYMADWPAIGTKQKGKHTVTYKDGSDDRIEIKKAISYITDLEEDNIIEHWIGNGGDQKVIATVSDKAMKNYYKIYLSWVKDEGWKPTKLEYLKAAEKRQVEEAPQENVEIPTEQEPENIVENEEG